MLNSTRVPPAEPGTFVAAPCTATRVMYVSRTADVITPDGSDTDVYGDPTEDGHGATLTHGWWAPEWSRWAVSEEYDPAAVLTHTPEDGQPVAWLARMIVCTVGTPDCWDGGRSIYSADACEDYATGVHVRPALHPEGFTPEEVAQAVGIAAGGLPAPEEEDPCTVAPDPVHLSISWGTSRARETFGYNIARLRDDTTGKVYRCTGGGYDMVGTVLAAWLCDVHAERLRSLWDRLQYRPVPDGQWGTERTGPDVLYGTRGRTDGTVYVDGGCGVPSVRAAAEAAGLAVVAEYRRGNGATTGFLVTATNNKED